MTVKITARQLETAARRLFTCAAAQLRGNSDANSRGYSESVEFNAPLDTIQVSRGYNFCKSSTGCITVFLYNDRVIK